jgi:hypothetical protein
LNFFPFLTAWVDHVMAARRNDTTIAKALAALANAMAQNNEERNAREARRGGEDELRLESS